MASITITRFVNNGARIWNTSFKKKLMVDEMTQS